MGAEPCYNPLPVFTTTRDPIPLRNESASDAKRGKNYARRIHERWRSFAKHILKCYKAAGHEVADRPVVFDENWNPIHPSLEAALKWAYALRDKRLAIRRAAEKEMTDADLLTRGDTAAVPSIGSRPNGEPEAEKAKPAGEPINALVEDSIERHGEALKALGDL